MQDQSLVHNHVEETISKHFPNDVEYVMRDPLLFGDYRNAMSEGEQRDYEDLLDYTAVFHLFQEVTTSNNTYMI